MTTSKMYLRNIRKGPKDILKLLRMRVRRTRKRRKKQKLERAMSLLLQRRKNYRDRKRRR